jgi:hypothetical protein
MTASTGVGRGYGSGGKRPGAGKKRGSRDRRTLARLALHEQKTKTDPLDFLLATIDDGNVPWRERINAASALLPYFHCRLNAMKILPSVATMGDADLLNLMEQISQRLGEPTAADRSRALANQADELMTAVDELSPHRQRALLNQLATATQAKLRELAKPQPGDVLPRQPQPVIEHEPITAPQRPVWGDGQVNGNGATGSPSRPGKRLRYDPDTGELIPLPS